MYRNLLIFRSIRLERFILTPYIDDNPEIKENWDTQFGDRENQVVFIGKCYNKDDIIVELEKCLDERAYA